MRHVILLELVQRDRLHQRHVNLIGDRNVAHEVRARAPEVEGRQPSMEDAFIAIVEAARQANHHQGSAA